MDNFINERDIEILENDKYTFFVLRLILGGKCELLLTDHERFILCFTCNPYPVWIWTPDDASEEEMERAYKIVSEHSMLNGGYRLNMKYDLANYFMKRASLDEKKLSVSLHMFAYDCPNPIRPSQLAEGSIYRCKKEDIDELVDFLELFHKTIGIDQKERDDYRLDAESYINSGNMFFWKNELGENVACCKLAPNGKMASVQIVFTRPEFRRKHYAENLVYEVTEMAKSEGYVPMLYTDADYVASNACYEKVGYILRGRLCAIE